MYACGSESTHPSHYVSFDNYLTSTVPAPVRPHFAEFIEHCKNSSAQNRQKCHENIKYLSDIELKTGLVDEERSAVIGLCEIGLKRKITLRLDIFNTNSLAFKALVWHELGHCLLDLDHTPDNSDLHIMNAYLPNERELGKKWSFYTDSLFSFDTRMSLTENLIQDLKE
jgi:hypothetical protein